MTTDDWVLVGMNALAVMFNALVMVKSIRPGPSNALAAKITLVLDIVLIVLATAWTVNSFSMGDLAGWVTGTLGATIVVISVIDMFILNRYLDRTEGDL